MKCVVIMMALLLAAATADAAEDPLESLNTVEDTLHALAQHRCNRPLHEASVQHLAAGQQRQLSTRAGEDSGASASSDQVGEKADDRCSPATSDDSR